MTDLDFDELDKAVTSIINKGNKRAAKPVESSESVEPSQPQAVEVGATPPSAAESPMFTPTQPVAESATGSVAEPAATVDEAPAEPAVPTTPTVAPPPRIAAARRGRFMDMVHPSAKMTKSSPTSPAARVARTGVTLAPIGTPDEPVARSESSAGESTDAVTESPSAPADSSTDMMPVEEPNKLPVDDAWEKEDSYTYHEDTAPLHTGDRTEPLVASSKIHAVEGADVEVLTGGDDATTNPAPEAPSYVTHTGDDIATPAEDTDAAFEQTGAESTKPDQDILDSINVSVDELTDESEAKVGAQAESTESTESHESPLEMPFVPDVKVDKRPLGSVPVATTGTTATSVDDTDAAEQAPEVPLPIDEPQTLEQLDKKVGEELTEVDMDIPADPTADDAGMAAVSIAPQYREAPKSTDETPSPIYDTANYHKPVSPEAKKHSPWMVVAWIFALLIVSAVAGAAAYYLMISR